MAVIATIREAVESGWNKAGVSGPYPAQSASRWDSRHGAPEGIGTTRRSIHQRLDPPPALEGPCFWLTLACYDAHNDIASTTDG